jgi:hypothetical protein
MSLLFSCRVGSSCDDCGAARTICWPLALSLNGSALYLGVALGSVVGAVVPRVGSPADLGWVAALFPLIGLAIVLAAAVRRSRSAAIAPAE